jgi:2-keto-3-deoxy-6-phosphogluconate aldolase
VSFLPSGGITPDNAAAWLDAGACACGMGSKLVGAAVRADPSDAAALAAAEDDWQKNGLPKATKLFASLA